MRGYGVPIVGTMKDLNKISIADLKKWYLNQRIIKWNTFDCIATFFCKSLLEKQGNEMLWLEFDKLTEVRKVLVVGFKTPKIPF